MDSDGNLILQESLAGAGGRRARRRWPWVLAAVVGGGGLVLWFVPALVAHSPLMGAVWSAAAARLNGRVSVESASLGWLSPIVFREVAVRDAVGEPLLEVAALRSEKSLLALLWNPQRAGLVYADRPRLRVVVRGETSNVEEAIRAFAGGARTASQSPDCRVVVSGGEVEIADCESGRSWSVRGLEAALAFQSAPADSLEAQLQCRLHAADGDAGRVAAQLTWRRSGPSAAPGAGGGHIAVQCQSAPLTVAQPVLRRFLKGLQLAGRCTADCRYFWDDAGPRQSLQIRQVVADGFSFAAPQWLGSDCLRIPHLEIRGEAVLRGGRLEWNGVTFDSGLGKLELTGAGKWAELTGRPLSTAAWEVIRDNDCRLSGELDLARLAEVLPNTFHLRHDAQIKSGRVSLSLSSRGEGDVRRWSGRLESSKWSAVRGGRDIDWENPIQVALAARQSPEGVAVERLTCDATFFRISGQGAVGQGELSAEADLDRLMADLDRLLDLGRFRLGGRLRAGLRWRRPSNERLDADADLSVQGFELQASSLRPWREDLLTATLAAEGVIDQNRLRGLRTAVVQMQSGSDRMEVELREPVVALSADAVWPVRCSLRGDLAAWLPRLQPLFSSNGLDAEGTIEFSAKADIASERLLLDSVVCRFEPFRLRRGDVDIRDPRVVVQGSGSWDAAQRRLDAGSMTLASSTLALRAEDVVWVLGRPNVRLTGGLAFRADLARLAAWLRVGESPPTRQLLGMVTGNARFRHEAGVTRAEWSADLQDLVYARRPARPAADGQAQRASSGGSPDASLQALWREQRLCLSGSCDYQHGRDRLTLAMLDAASVSDSVRLSMRGEIADVAARPFLDLKGRLEYDLEGVVEQLRPFVGRRFDMAGRAAKPFSIRGPLSAAPELSERRPGAGPGGPEDRASAGPAAPRGWAGEASIGWSSASFHGIAAGPGELRARLARGVLAFDPLDLQLSDGRLKLSPQVNLDAAPVSLLLARGPALERVRISSEMCRTWLKYIAPLLADATQAEGHFSLTLDGASVPLATPQATRAQGVMTIHEAQVGPGPLSREFLGIAQQIKAIVQRRPFGAQDGAVSQQWLTLPAQDVAFEMADGRVRHRGFQWRVSGVSMRTQGWVGLDQSLALEAEIPIQDEWVQSDRFLSALKGQVVRIPVGGELSRPRIDQRVLRELASQTLGGAATKLLENELNRGLQQLFGRSPQAKP